jgi:AcrR family transcriptional regulator
MDDEALATTISTSVLKQSCQYNRPMCPETVPASSARRDELLEKAYRHVLEHGLTGMSLRPLAAAVQSSPRVLLFLFESKDALVRALLARARADEVELLEQLETPSSAGLARVAGEIWGWLAAAEHRGLLRLWLESYSRSLVDPAGSWSGFANATVRDWLALLAKAQPAHERDTASGMQRRTVTLALLRGALLDLLASGDVERTTDAVLAGLARLDGPRP